MKYKQAGLSMLGTAVTTLLITIITIGIGASILENYSESLDCTGNCTLGDQDNPVTANGSTYSAAFNITTKGIKGIGNLAEWFPTIAIVLAAVVVIGLSLIHI